MGAKQKGGRAGSVFLLLVESKEFFSFRLVRDSAEGWWSQTRWGGVGGMGFGPETADLGGRMWRESGGCGIRIDLARLWPVFGP